ncbi:MAG: Ig-like domain-containing protein [Gammaproteobacteria bacterium]|nr:Ig-like domain-containing protein [Gammaproteobacteria bacterium]
MNAKSIQALCKIGLLANLLFLTACANLEDDSNIDVQETTVEKQINSRISSSDNIAPVAYADIVGVLEGSFVEASFKATDSESDALAYKVYRYPLKGDLAIIDHGLGTYRYTPRSGMTGADSFDFLVDDGIDESNIATVTLNIVLSQQGMPSAGNTIPISSNATLSVNEDQRLSSQLIASDYDGDGLTFTITQMPSKGLLALTDLSTGQFSYIPDEDVNGADSFKFKVNDGFVDSNIATVTLNILPINDAPFVRDDSFETPRDVALTITTLLDNDFDIDGDLLSIISYSQANHGVVVSGADNSFVYTPDSGYRGNDMFYYTVQDTVGVISSAQVNITVSGQDFSPVAANDSANMMVDGGTLQLAVMSNDSNLIDTPIVLTIVNSGASFGNAIVNADGTIDYTPNAGFTGSDSFNYRITDADGDTSTATVTVTVEGNNATPLAQADAIVINQNSGAQVIDVVANDSGLDDGPISVTIQNAGPANGTAVVNGDGSISYTPNTDFFGSDSFNYQIADIDGDVAVATVSIDVNCITGCSKVMQISWTASTTVGVTSYKVHVGSVSGQYDEVIDVGNVTSYTYNAMTKGDYVFAVTAVDENSVESLYSDEAQASF